MLIDNSICKWALSNQRITTARVCLRFTRAKIDQFTQGCDVNMVSFFRCFQFAASCQNYNCDVLHARIWIARLRVEAAPKSRKYKLHTMLTTMPIWRRRKRCQRQNGDKSTCKRCTTNWLPHSADSRAVVACDWMHATNIPSSGEDER